MNGNDVNPSEEACINCRFFHDGEGTCNRYAPRPVMVAEWSAAVEHDKGYAIWLCIEHPKSTWCGDYERYAE
jgi:hypothetical protein